MSSRSSRRRGVDRLSREDRRILRLEAGPIAGHTCKVLTVGPSEGGRPTLEQLRESIAQRLGMAPRLRQRLLKAPLGMTPRVWVDDAAFDLRRHVRQLGEGSELDDGQLRQEVARLMAERLDRARPLWTLDMAPLTEGRTALVWRIHHCMADGNTAMRLGSIVLWDREPHLARPAAEPWVPAPPPRALALGAAALGERAIAAVAALGGAARALRTPASWRSAAAELGQLPGTLRRELAPVALPSLLARPAGADRVVAWTSAPLAGLRRAGKAVSEEITVNDVVLSVAAGGFHHWLAARGSSGRGVRVKVPVSLHARGADSANRDSFLFVDLPVDEPSAVRRLRAINRETTERKRHRDAERLDWLLRGVSHLPGGGRAMRLTMSPRLFTFSVSNVPGPREPLFVLGRPLLEICTLAEIAPSHAVRMAVLSASGSLCFGLCADREAVPDLDLFIAGIEHAVEELLARDA